MEIQEEWMAKVIKNSIIGIRKGFIFKKFQHFEAFMLDTGVILFYSLGSTKEQEKMRIYLDDTVNISNREGATIQTKNRYGAMESCSVTRFNLRICDVNYRIETNTDEDWIGLISDFDFHRQ